jgi:hypothetical protein
VYDGKKGATMTDAEKRQILLIVGASTAILLLLAAAVILFDIPTLLKNALPNLQFDFEPRYFDEETIHPDEFRLPRNVTMRGPVERNQTVTGTVSMTRMEGWTLAGYASDVYLLDFEQVSGQYVWQMEVYGPDQELFAFTADSDIGYADFTQLEIKLPQDGTYTIVLSGVGMDGKYSLEIW